MSPLSQLTWLHARVTFFEPLRNRCVVRLPQAAREVGHLRVELRRVRHRLVPCGVGLRHRAGMGGGVWPGNEIRKHMCEIVNPPTMLCMFLFGNDHVGVRCLWVWVAFLRGGGHCV